MYIISGLFFVLAVLIISDSALAQPPSCPCDTATLKNGLTGNDIVNLICPNGNLGEDSGSISDPSNFGIFTNVPPKPDYFVTIGFQDVKSCAINADGVSEVRLEISDSEYEFCKQRLIDGCNLNVRPIPTLDKWALIGLAGFMAVIGFIALYRKNQYV